MSKPETNPARLSHLPETEDSLGVGRLFRNARELPDEELPRLRWRLRTSLRLRAMRPRLFLRVALVIGIVFCVGGVVGAVVVSPFWARKEPLVGASPSPAWASSPRHRKPQLVTPSPATPALSEPVPDDPKPVPDQPEPVPAAAKNHAAVRVAGLTKPTPRAPGKATEMAPPPAPPSRIAIEQALLSQAMKTLRDDRDAQASLALLAQHAQRFSDSAFASEATMLRIEALLALGRRDEALSALDGAPLASLPNRDEQLVVRGELRAADRRWRAAEQDFDEVLRERSLPAASARARDLQERALWGRAAARSRLGDEDGARADLELYLRHFPAGRFAGPAASLLKGEP